MNYSDFLREKFHNANVSKEVPTVVSGVPPLQLDRSSGKDLIKYKLYGNTTQNGTPSLENPVEVVSVGTKTNNLFDINNPVYSTNSTVKPTISASINTIYSSGVFNSSQITSSLLVPCKKNDVLSISFNVTQGGAGVNVNTFSSVNTISQSFVTWNTKHYGKQSITNIMSDTDGYIGIEFISDYNRGATITDLQIEYGSTVTEFKPYGYEIPLIARTKNILNLSGRTLYTSGISGPSTKVDFSNKYMFFQYAPSGYNLVGGSCLITDTTNNTVEFTSNTGWYGVGFNIDVTNGKTYSASVKNSGDEDRCYTSFTTYDENGFFKRNTNSPVTIANDEKYCIVSFRFTDANKPRKLTNLQVEVSNVSTAYTQPKFEKTSIYLDNPLRKVNNVTDTLDFALNRVVRNTWSITAIGYTPVTVSSGESIKIKFTDSITSSTCAKYSTNGVSFGISGTYQMKVGPTTSLNGFCKNVMVKNELSTAYEHIVFGWGNSTFYSVGLSTTAVFSDAVNRLKSIIDSGNFEITYILSTPITKTISLPSVSIPKGDVIFEVDSPTIPSNVELTYYKK